MLPKVPGEGPRDLSKPLESIRILVDQRLDGQRLDVALATVLTWRSRSSIHRLLDAGLVRVDGREPSASRRVRLGSVIVVELPPRPVPAPSPDAPTTFGVLYEDQWMVAVDKPPGMAVHPSGRHLDGTLMQDLHRRYRNTDDPEKDVVPRLLHRIDLETSGLVGVGLDEQFHQLVSRQFEDRLVQKSYLAVVRGVPAAAEGTIDLSIVPDKTSAVRLKLTTSNRGDGLSAVTHWRVVRGNGRHTLLEVRPKTGRTHQIRVHMAAIGCPLVGDKLYGGDEQLFLRQVEGTLDDAQRASLGLDRHALHSHTLTFFHPMLGRECTLEAPLPADMARLLE
ncbi:MAG: RluA family pseudouridine synthase [Planctomycetes bacterium]|nr:RluA family pseudouridine synthase [Planctomycetota bacterium]